MKEKQGEISEASKKEKEPKPLNPENWEILTKYEEEYRKHIKNVKAEIKDIEERFNKGDLTETDAQRHLRIYENQLAEAELKIVEIRQMMRAETGDSEIEFENIEK